MKSISITGKSLSLEDISAIAYDLESKIKVSISPKVIRKIHIARKFIESKLMSNEPIYGVNTGFGVLANVKIDNAHLDELQINLLRSHAVGIGPPLSIPEVRASILLRANTLACGNSGVSLELVNFLLKLLNFGIHPYIPEQGSVGASGDLAPLAHLALVIIGEGKAYYHGKLISGKSALKLAGLKPYKIKAKEGLSLINGTQIMTAIGTLAFLKAEKLARLADIATAMSIEATRASDAPFDVKVHEARPHEGQIECAAFIRSLLKNSSIMHSHEDCDKIQDPYSFRCAPQVHGIVRDTIKNVRKVLEVEVNSVTDNPLVFAKSANHGRIVNAGNFHGEYVAIAMDHLAIALSELANISEQRIEKLINPIFSELPRFLTKNGGLNSGFMIVQVAAASLVSENKSLSHPASVDSIATNGDKEDHVSMGTIAARKTRTIIGNSWKVLAMEFLCAAQGLDFRLPLLPSKRITKIYKLIRKHSKHVDKDRAFHIDIEKISALMEHEDFDIK